MMDIEVYSPEEPFQHFFYQDIHLDEACWIDGVPYFTRRAIGEWLEYKTPRRSIDKIIKRNPHIEDPRWSSVVKLTTELDTGKGTKYERETEMPTYNPVGLQLITFESRQPKATAYKIAAANLVWAYAQGRIAPPQASAIHNDLKDIVFLKRWTKERRRAVEQLAKKLNISLDTVYRYAKKTENCEPLKKPMRKGYTCKRNKEARANVMRINKKFPEIRKEELAVMANVHTATIYRWLNK